MRSCRPVELLGFIEKFEFSDTMTSSVDDKGGGGVTFNFLSHLNKSFITSNNRPKYSPHNWGFISTFNPSLYPSDYFSN